MEKKKRLGRVDSKYKGGRTDSSADFDTGQELHHLHRSYHSVAKEQACLIISWYEA